MSTVPATKISGSATRSGGSILNNLSVAAFAASSCSLPVGFDAGGELIKALEPCVLSLPPRLSGVRADSFSMGHSYCYRWKFDDHGQRGVLLGEIFRDARLEVFDAGRRPVALCAHNLSDRLDHEVFRPARVEPLLGAARCP